MKKNNPAQRAGKKNNLALILSEKISWPGPKTQAPPPPPPEYQMDRALYGYSEKPPHFSRLLRHAGDTEYRFRLKPPGPHGG